MTRSLHDSRRAVALIVVLLAMSVAVTVLAGLQAVSFRQAASGRETAARFRAYWAARAGVEATLARLEQSLDAGESGAGYAELDAMLSAASGELDGASWSITHDALRETRDGPADPHSKINVNLMSADDLMLLSGMSEDVADAILDWIDEDDSPRPLGAEEGYYSQLASPYAPRNGPVTSLRELELAAGVTPEDVRGEDWNLNGRLDPNEDDGDETHPPDNADGVLDAGWSAIITASSVEPALDGGESAGGGQLRVDLLEAETEELVSRISSLDVGQATVILDYGSREGSRVEDLISTSLQQIAQQSSGLPATVRNLNDQQLRELLASCTVDDPTGPPRPGRINLNTVRRETLDYVSALPAALADALLVARDASPTGFESLMDLLEVPAMSRQRLTRLSSIIGVEPGAYVISSLGRDNATGTEAEVVVKVLRSSLPVPIVEVRTP